MNRNIALSMKKTQDPSGSTMKIRVQKKPQRKKGWFISQVVVLMIMCAVAFSSLLDLGKNIPQKQHAEKKGLREHNDSSVGKCTLEGSMDPPAESIVIDFTKINNIDKDPLERVKDYTTEKYTKHLLKSAGFEHYAFLNYISATYGDCRHFMDIGTRVVTSALALGSSKKSPVWTFDIPKSRERMKAFRGKTEEEWHKQIREVGVDIVFHNLDLIKISDVELKKFLGTWFVMLDTFHYPYTRPFEREFFQRILEIGFKGILVLDDIYFNDEMKKWWKELQDNAEESGYMTYDVTEIGHNTGTGVVDFSGKVTIKE